MLEEVYNLFYFSSDGKSISHVGIATHNLSGSDDEKLSFLKKNINSDLCSCEYFDVSPQCLGTNKTLSVGRYMALARRGIATLVYELALQAKRATDNPLVICTAVVNGQIKVDGNIDVNKELRRDDFPSNSIPGVRDMPDYLDKYIVNGRFYIKDLLVDDHVKAIHLLFNNKHYLSSIKLLMSFIDTVAFLEFGDVNKAFPVWLDKYCELSTLKITSNELYELRHSLLHMTNLNSRKVIQGVERRISYSIGPVSTPTREHDGIVFFNYLDFIPLFESAMDKWLATYDGEKIITFIERYDQVVRENY
ncbi:hypothetical protein [Enterobacter sp. CC120223-11]|uniref:hypothetical protein n=1 Tax=Enterobacter sp. CC120223-11 TaxID=1378073 RepID=UPI000BC4ECF1|nr:hypothetical protein [Enterobacter sp. CC120223-11]SNY68204.1 hypothetical protein SAMN02744775_01862 [Enterobacter sp. CC120223-11]